ncbi:hypothetical protein [Mycoplasma sp. 4423]
MKDKKKKNKLAMFLVSSAVFASAVTAAVIAAVYAPRSSELTSEEKAKETEINPKPPKQEKPIDVVPVAPVERKEQYLKDINAIKNTVNTKRFSKTSYFDYKSNELLDDLRSLNTVNKKANPSEMDANKMSILFEKAWSLIKVSDAIESLFNKVAKSNFIDEIKKTFYLDEYQNLLWKVQKQQTDEAKINDDRFKQNEAYAASIDDSDKPNSLVKQLQLLKVRSDYQKNFETIDYLQRLISLVKDKKEANADSQPQLQKELNAIKISLETALLDNPDANVNDKLESLKTKVLAKLKTENTDENQRGQLLLDAQKDSLIQLTKQSEDLDKFDNQIKNAKTQAELDKVKNDLDKALDLLWVNTHTLAISQRLDNFKVKFDQAGEKIITIENKHLFNGNYLDQGVTQIQYDSIMNENPELQKESFIKSVKMFRNKVAELKALIAKIDSSNAVQKTYSDNLSQIISDESKTLYDINLLEEQVNATLKKQDFVKQEVDLLNKNTEVPSNVKSAFIDLLNASVNDSLLKLDQIKWLSELYISTLNIKKAALDEINKIADDAKKQELLKSFNEIISPILDKIDATSADISKSVTDILEKIATKAKEYSETIEKVQKDKNEDELKNFKFDQIDNRAKFLQLLTKAQTANNAVAKRKAINEVELGYVKSIQDIINEAQKQKQTNFNNVTKDGDKEIADINTIYANLKTVESSIVEDTTTEKIIKVLEDANAADIATLKATDGALTSDQSTNFDKELEEAKKATSNTDKLKKLQELKTKLFEAKNKAVDADQSLIPDLIEKLTVQKTRDTFKEYYQKNKATMTSAQLVNDFLYGNPTNESDNTKQGILTQLNSELNSELVIQYKNKSDLDKMLVDSNPQKKESFDTVSTEFSKALTNNVIDLSKAVDTVKAAKTFVGKLIVDAYDLWTKTLFISQEDGVNGIGTTKFRQIIRDAEGSEEKLKKAIGIGNQLLEKFRFAVVMDLRKLSDVDQRKVHLIEFLQGKDSDHVPDSVRTYKALSIFINAIVDTQKLIDQIKDQNNKSQLQEELRVATDASKVNEVKVKVQKALDEQNKQDAETDKRDFDAKKPKIASLAATITNTDAKTKLTKQVNDSTNLQELNIAEKAVNDQLASEKTAKDLADLKAEVQTLINKLSEADKPTYQAKLDEPENNNTKALTALKNEVEVKLDQKNKPTQSKPTDSQITSEQKQTPQPQEETKNPNNQQANTEQNPQTKANDQSKQDKPKTNESTTTNTETKTPTNSRNSKSKTTAAIIAAVVSSVIALITLLSFGWYLKKKKNNKA